MKRWGAVAWRAAMVVLLTLGAGGALASEIPSYTPDPNASREEVPEVFRWDLSALFATEADWKAEIEVVARQVEELASFPATDSDAQTLARILGLYFDTHDRANHCTLYANLIHSVRLDDDHAGAMETQSLALMDEVMTQATTVRQAILSFDDQEMTDAYASEKDLQTYRSYIENIRRRRDRVLDPQAERVLNLMGDNLWAEIDLNEIPSKSENAFGALLTDIAWPKIIDEDGNEVQMTLASYGKYRASENREVRRQAVQAFFGTLYQFRHAFAATLSGQYEFSTELARARGYESAKVAYLDKYALAPAVYDNLISTVRAHTDVLHRYVSLRKTVMGLDAVHLYDLYVPMVDAEIGAGDGMDYATARETLIEALGPLGKEYGQLLAYGTDPANGWIDVYPHAAKRSGAFSASVYGVHPYVLMNFQNSQDDMFTLAHEFGHAIHSHLAMTSQPYSAFRYVPFLAEIASTCNEALVNDYLLRHSQSDEERISLLLAQAENIRTTIFRQTLFAQFERDVHAMVGRGEAVTADALDELYAGLVRDYYGPDYVLDDYDGMEWAYVPHFYYKFYVFTYATGLSSGIAIADRVREMGEPAVKGLMAMLSGGSSEAPLQLLARAGVDLTQPAPIEAAIRRLAETLDELELLLVKGSR